MLTGRPRGVLRVNWAFGGGMLAGVGRNSAIAEPLWCKGYTQNIKTKSEPTHVGCRAVTPALRKALRSYDR